MSQYGTARYGAATYSLVTSDLAIDVDLKDRALGRVRLFDRPQVDVELEDAPVVRLTMTANKEMP